MPIKTSRFDVDIITQSLSELIQRPRLGTIKGFEAEGYVAANTANLVWYLTGAGMHWGIYVWGYSTGLMDDDYIRVIADGSTVNLPTFKECFDNNYTMPIGAEMTLTLYDPVNFKAGGFGGAGKTWSQYHSGYYVETMGRNPYMKVKFIYSVF